MDRLRNLPSKKRIALVAHDHKKADLIDWAVYNKKVLIQHELVATGTTGKLLQEQLDYPVRKLLSGPLGGDQQIGALIAEGNLDIIIFFLGSNGAATARQRCKSPAPPCRNLEYYHCLQPHNSRFCFDLYPDGYRLFSGNS